MNTINFTIDFELHHLSDERYKELIYLFQKKIIEYKPDALTFDEIKEIIPLDEVKYVTTSIEHPRMEHIPKGEVRTRETKIEIKLC